MMMLGSLEDLWCADCGKGASCTCVKHGALHKVQDAVIPSRARLTLPPSLSLKSIKENGKTSMGIFSKRIIPVRSQFGPLDAPVISRTKIPSKEKKEATFWKKKQAMRKSLEMSQSAEAFQSTTDKPPSTGVTGPGIHKMDQHVHDIPNHQNMNYTNQSNQHLMSPLGNHMLGQPTSHDDGLQVLPPILQLPLQSSPIVGGNGLHQLQLQQNLHELAPISFPSLGDSAMQMPVPITPENLQALQQYYGGQSADFGSSHHSLGTLTNLNAPTTTVDNTAMSLPTITNIHSVIVEPEPSAEDSGVCDTSHGNSTDPTIGDVTSDTELDESSEQDLNFEIKVVTDDGYMETLDVANEDHSNWMIFVRPARTVVEQNLIAYQEDGHIFYVSLKPVPTNTELKVWYSADYAKALQKSLLPTEQETTDTNESVEKKLQCYSCNTVFNTFDDLESHLCNGKVKGRRKGRPRKYIKPTKSWRQKLEKSRLKDSVRVNKRTVYTGPPRPRGRPRVKPLVDKPEKTEKIHEILDFDMDINNDDDNDDGGNKIEIIIDGLDLKTPSKERKKRSPKKNKEPLSCPHCCDRFAAEAAFFVHVYTHTGIKPFICEVPECQKGFLSKFKLERHRLIHTSPRHHSCMYCDKSFNRKDHLKNHLVTHDPNKKIWKCELCGKEYSYSFSFRTHMAFHSAQSGETLTCGICKKEHDSKEALLFHLKIHTGARAAKNATEKTHECRECDKKFFTRKDVKRHMITHTKRKDFLCQFCPQRFGRKDHLTRHLRTSHTGDNANGRMRRSHTETLIRKRDHPLYNEKLEPTFVPLQMALPTQIIDDVQDQLLAAVSASNGSSATLLQNLQHAVSQMPAGVGGGAREFSIPAALYEAAAAAVSGQPQPQAVTSINTIQPPPGMPTINTNPATAQYAINDKGYLMNTIQPDQALQIRQIQQDQTGQVRQLQDQPGQVRQLQPDNQTGPIRQLQPDQTGQVRQLQPDQSGHVRQLQPAMVDYRNISQSLQGNLYIASSPLVVPQQQLQQQQPVMIATPDSKLDTAQLVDVNRTNNILQAEYQVTQHNSIPPSPATTVSMATDQSALTSAAAVLMTGGDPRQNPHSQTFSTLLGYMETLRFLENLPTNNTTAIQLQQLQNLNVEMTQGQQTHLIPVSAYNAIAGNPNIVNINQADLAKHLVINQLSQPELAKTMVTVTHPQHMAELHSPSAADMKAFASMAHTPIQQIAYQPQTQQPQT